MKLKTLILSFLLLILLSSCSFIEQIDVNKITMIMPTGTPSLILSQSIEEYGNIDVEIVSGPNALAAEFTKAQKDIIVAPVNLGAKLASSSDDFKYVMFHTIVWCNYYIVSKEPINSFEELDNKDITIFGQNSTPDVIFRTLIAHYNINPKVEYMASVADANKMLLANKTDIILSAEPALSNILNKGNFYIYSLADEWTKIANFKGADVPQAAIFVKKESIDKTNIFLDIALANVIRVEKNKEEVVKAAKRQDKLLVTDEEVLISSISRCNFKINQYEKQSIEMYFNMVIDLGLGNTVGGKLPDETFYYKK